MDQEQPKQQSNCVKYCTSAIRCVGFIIICPFMVVGTLLFGTLFVGPLAYYRGTILNSNALAENYSKDGVRLQGKVIARWTNNSGDHGPTFHVRVVYRVDRERYVRNDLTVSQELYSKPKQDLIRLPDYPRSAILFSGVDGIDRDFPPSKLPSIYFGFVWMSIWNGVPLSIILSSIYSCDYCTNLFAPIFCGMIALELLIGYFVAKKERNVQLKSTLYGARRVARSRNDDPVNAINDTPPKNLSYGDFFDEGKHSCYSVISNICLDFITAIAWIGVAIYFSIFGGGYMIMYSLVAVRWRYAILKRYESHGAQAVGTIICRQGHMNGVLIVQYTVDEQMYKKRLAVPFYMVRSGCIHRHQYESVSEDPNLLYINDNPASAVLKCQIDNPQYERKRFLKNISAGLYVMAIQVSLFTLMIGAINEIDGAQSFILLAGILCLCEGVFGLLGACIHHTFFYKRELLWGAKRIIPRGTENDEVIQDEEQELAVAIVEDWGELENSTQITLDESESTRESFVDKFRKSKLFV